MVTYKDPSSTHLVTTLIHIIDGKNVDCKKARPRKTVVDPIALDPNFKTSKIFVGGLSKTLTLQALQDYFSRLSKVVDCLIASDMETKKSGAPGSSSSDLLGRGGSDEELL